MTRSKRSRIISLLSYIIIITILLSLAACNGTMPRTENPTGNVSGAETDGSRSNTASANRPDTESGDSPTDGKTPGDIASQAVSLEPVKPITLTPEESDKPGQTTPATAPVDPAGYAGLWQDSPMVGSGYSRRLALNADGMFYFAENEMDSMTRERFRRGTWVADGGVLTLVITARILWAGGYIVDDPIYLSGTSISDPDIVLFDVTDTIALDISEVASDPDAMGKRSFSIDGDQYWELAAEPDSLRDDYEAAKSSSKRASDLSLPLAGCWETTDRGEGNGIVRVNETLGGRSVSIRADWIAIEFGSNGEFALWARDWSNGYWTVNCFTGVALTDGKYLYLFASGEYDFGGKTFETIDISSYTGFPEHPCEVMSIDEWDEYSLSLSGIEYMSNFAGKGDGPPWSGSMIDYAITNHQSPASASDLRDACAAYARILERESAILALPEDLSTLEYPDMALLLDIGSGRISLEDLTGDGIPELIALSHVGGYEEWINIWSWINGTVVKVFGQRVRSLAGGGGNYSVFVTKSGGLYIYFSEMDANFNYGFWDVGGYVNWNSYQGYDSEPYAVIGNRDKAMMYCETPMDSPGAPRYYINGGNASAAEADAWLKNTFSAIDYVLMDSAAIMVVNDAGNLVNIGLYAETYGPWGEYAPYVFDEECTILDAALAMLDA